MGSQYDVPSDVDSDKEITNNNDSDEEVSESDEKLNEGSDEEQRNEESECEEEENLDSDQEDVNDESDEEMIEFDEEVNESDEGISNESEEDEDAAPKVVSMSSGKRKVMDDIQKRINLKSSNETAQKKALKEKRAKRLNMYQQQRIDKEKIKEAQDKLSLSDNVVANACHLAADEEDDSFMMEDESRESGLGYKKVKFQGKKTTFIDNNQNDLSELMKKRGIQIVNENVSSTYNEREGKQFSDNLLYGKFVKRKSNKALKQMQLKRAALLRFKKSRAS